MTSELLHSTRVERVACHSFAVSIERPTGRFAVDGTYQVHGTGKKRFTVLNLFQKLDEATRAQVLRSLGSRLHGAVTVRLCVPA